MQANYRDAVISPAQLPTVLGRRLLPFSVGHAHVLDALGSPYVAGFGQQDFGEMAQAVWVCSQPWSQALEQINHPKGEARISRKCQRWAAKFQRMTGSQWLDEREAFNDYLAFYWQTAARVNDGNDADMRCPLSYMLVWLMAGKRWPSPADEAAYLDMPLVKAFAVISTANAAEGDDSLVSEKEAIISENFDRIRGLN